MAVRVRRAVRLPAKLAQHPVCRFDTTPVACSDVSTRYIRTTTLRDGGDPMSKRSGVLELAVLGLLHESPLHGYELRKRVNALLGPLRAISYGSLYPCLKEMLAAGLLAADEASSEAGAGRRSRIVYKLTAEGKERLQEQLAEGGPAAWDDAHFPGGSSPRAPRRDGTTTASGGASRSSRRPTPTSGSRSSRGAAAASRSGGR